MIMQDQPHRVRYITDSSNSLRVFVQSGSSVLIAIFRQCFRPLLGDIES